MVPFGSNVTRLPWPDFDELFEYDGTRALVSEVDFPAGGDTFQLFRKRSNRTLPRNRITVIVGSEVWPGANAARSYTDGTDQGFRPGAVLGAPQIASSTADLHRWHRAIEEGDVLGAEARAMLHAPRIRMNESGGSYAYGWMDDGHHETGNPGRLASRRLGLGRLQQRGVLLPLGGVPHRDPVIL